MKLLCCFFLLFSTFISASNINNQKRTAYAVKDTHNVPDDWVRVHRAPLDQEIRLHIGLKQSRFDELERHLYEVSDPTHYRYGLHLTAAEVNDLVRPHESALRYVKEWLLHHNLEEDSIESSPAQDWITLRMKVDAVEKLLQTEYSVYKRKSDDALAIRAPQWSLPQYLHEHIEAIQPTNSFFHIPSSASDLYTRLSVSESFSIFERSENGDPDSLGGTDINLSAEQISGEPSQNLDLNNISPDLTIEEACNSSAINPICVRVLYGTLGYKPRAAGRNRMALTNYLSQFNNRTDLETYLATYRPDALPSYSFTNINIAGGVNKQTPATPAELSAGLGREGNLDAQIMLGIAHPTPLTTYSTLGHPPPFHPDLFTPSNTNEPYLTWLNAMLALPDPLPQVISTSYGDIEHTVPPAYAARVCRAFAQLGARGVSLIHGSGDTGVGKPGTCFSNNPGSPATPEFLTSFPEACPYVTSVGATRGVRPETVAFNPRNGFVSGGGFSKYFPRPPYQDGAVPPYLARLNGSYAGMYNARGRAYPDVSAQGYRIATVWNGTHYHVDGTSASAPTFAAVVALVNDALLAEGRPPMGFLNPWLYRIGHEAFTDVTEGSTAGCGVDGWWAGKGWDVASGWGTPVSSLRRAAWGWEQC
ncbi:hypothetical protein MMC11_006640 [Xylographa trunciseda]|nr:hypothetical protein [Xylographa trunciseda]